MKESITGKMGVEILQVLDRQNTTGRKTYFRFLQYIEQELVRFRYRDRKVPIHYLRGQQCLDCFPAQSPDVSV